MGTRELALSHTAVVRLEDFQPEHFGGSQPRSDAGDAMAEIAITLQTVVLGHTQVQPHELIALSGVLQSSGVGGFDPHPGGGAINARTTLTWARPDMDFLSALDLFYEQAFQP